MDDSKYEYLYKDTIFTALSAEFKYNPYVVPPVQAEVSYPV